MLVDMAGSENIEQAGQTGLEAKMQVDYVKKIFSNYLLKHIVKLCCLFPTTWDSRNALCSVGKDWKDQSGQCSTEESG